MFYIFVAYLFLCCQAFCLTSLYYVENTDVCMGAGQGFSVNMRPLHDEMCARERGLTESIREKLSYPHEPNVMVAAFTIFSKKGDPRIVRLNTREKAIAYCSNSSIVEGDGSEVALYGDPSSVVDKQAVLRNIADATSCANQQFYLPGMRSILDSSMNRVQDCGHTEPKVIDSMIAGGLFSDGTTELAKIFGSIEDLSSIVLNLHSYLYPCTTCKDLLIHFGWYVNDILQKNNVTFRICMTYRHANGSRAKPDSLPWGMLSINDVPPCSLSSRGDSRPFRAPARRESVPVQTRQRVQSNDLKPSAGILKEVFVNVRNYSSKRGKAIDRKDIKCMVEARVQVLQLVAYVSEGLPPADLESEEHLAMYRSILETGEVDTSKLFTPRGQGSGGAQGQSVKRKNEKDGPIQISPEQRRVGKSE